MSSLLANVLIAPPVMSTRKRVAILSAMPEQEFKRRLPTGNGGSRHIGKQRAGMHCVPCGEGTPLHHRERTDRHYLITMPIDTSGGHTP